MNPQAEPEQNRPARRERPRGHWRAGGRDARRVLRRRSALPRCSARRPAMAARRRRASRAPARRGERNISVRFDANVAPGLAWRFEPETPEITLRPGETATVFFRATNLSDRPTEGVGALQCRARPGRGLVRQADMLLLRRAEAGRRMKPPNGRWSSSSIRNWSRTRPWPRSTASPCPTRYSRLRARPKRGAAEIAAVPGKS